VVNASIQFMLFRALFSKSNCEHTQNSEMVKYCITTPFCVSVWCHQKEQF